MCSSVSGRLHLYLESNLNTVCVYRYYKPARLKKETERAHCVTYTADPGASAAAAAAAAAAGVRPGEMRRKYTIRNKIK